MTQFSTYEALPGRMRDDAARAARGRLARPGRNAGRRSVLAFLLPRRRRAYALSRAV
jgi:hypothetical protein